ncbi:MAG TPA: penicillin acylase family protein [Thermoleophilaceae bacterium]|nr:penicillin acylase family protein [Thermoleophilaceae bacterium]
MAAPAAAVAAPGDVARQILPPGNYGGARFTVNSRDQLPLYDALTPLRGNITTADIDRYFLPENFEPIGPTTEEQTGRPGLRLLYDQYGIPHVYGKTRADVAFGAGWTTARDRQLLVALGRYPARVAIADVPGIDAFSLVTSGQSFVPSPQAEALVTKQRKLIVREFGKKGRQILADARAYANGLTAYARAHGDTSPRATINDVIAVTAFIGSIFGAGGGGEAANSELLAKLQRGLGRVRGYRAWDDVMLAEDPEAPTSLKQRFPYRPLTGGKVRGSLVVDPGSVRAFDPLAGASAGGAAVNAAAAPPRRQASNWLITAPQRSSTRNSLAVMGPQLGYYYPEIVQQMDLHGPGYRAQGIAVPGLAMYILIGRTNNYAWSLTSAGHDIRDVFAEKLCNRDGSRPTRASKHYLYRGKCRRFKRFDAGQLDGKPLRYRTSVHGPVIGTATVRGRPYALARKRSSFGRDGLNLAGLKDMTDGKASTPKRFWKAANQFEFTFNWGYASRKATSYFTSGRLPRRARGLDRRLPTLGTGKYEWRGFLSRREHPHGVSGPRGLLLNWNNQSAPGFMHGDDEPYGSAHRVELFDRFPSRVKLTDVVGVMNRAATEDVRSPVWPVISRVLRTGPAPNARAQQVVDLLDDWVSRDAPRLDADNDGFFDDPGPAILDEAWTPIAEAVMRPVLGNLTDDVNDVRSLSGGSGHSYVDKDLRRLAGRKVRGKFHLRYCGKGSLPACRAALWAVIGEAANELATEFGPDPTTWLKAGDRTSFVPGLLPDTFRATNRPTFQQVLEFAHP